MKRIYLLAYITILCCLCPLLKAQLGPMPFTPVPPNDPSLVRLLNSDVRCRQWVDSVMQRLTLKERIGQLFIYTIAPQQDKANKELLRKVVEDYKVGGLLFSGGLMQNQVMLTNEAQRMAEVPLMITFDGEWRRLYSPRRRICRPRAERYRRPQVRACRSEPEYRRGCRGRHR